MLSWQKIYSLKQMFVIPFPLVNVCSVYGVYITQSYTTHEENDVDNVAFRMQSGKRISNNSRCALSKLRIFFIVFFMSNLYMKHLTIRRSCFRITDFTLFEKNSLLSKILFLPRKKQFC